MRLKYKVFQHTKEANYADSKYYQEPGKVQQDRHKSFVVWGNLAIKTVNVFRFFFPFLKFC